MEGRKKAYRLLIKERLQAGDVFLFKFECPNCRSEKLEPYPLNDCLDCACDFSESELFIEHKTLLQGTLDRRKLSETLKKEVLNFCGRTCYYCLEDLSDREFHIDHIFPLLAGGATNLDNLIVACPKCNLIANNRIFANPETKRDFVLKKRRIK